MADIEDKKNPTLFTPGKIHITEEMTIPWLIRNIAQEQPEKPTFSRKSALGSWLDITWGAFEAEYRRLARGFIALGIEPGERVALMSHTRYEFTLIDFALWSIGAMAVPIYETDSTSQSEWIIQDAHCRFAIAENAQLKATLLPIIDSVEHFEHIYVIENNDLENIAAKGSMDTDPEIDRRTNALNADDPATIIYTSGSTGCSKGVILSHRNFLHVVMNGTLDDELSIVLTGNNRRTLLFLPMAHVFARFTNILAMYAGVKIGYCPDTSTLVNDLQSFKPHFMLAVPRVFEKIYNAIDARSTGAKQKLFRYYAKVAIQYSRALDTETGPSVALRMQHKIGERLVYSKIKALTGGHLEWVISGGAPLGARLGHFFRSIGINCLEGYGCTETSAPTCVNRPGFQRIGSVGPAYPGCHISIDDDGEILVKGDHVFKEYLNNPEETATSFTQDGWFKTGDLGEIRDGVVYITGRKKELIVTAGGKNVSPAILEDALRGHPLISQVVVVGDKRPFIGALITLDADMLPLWLKNKGLPEIPVAEARKDPQIIAAIDRAVKRANSQVSRAESIRKFVILPIDFTTENTYLTASMKVRRSRVLSAFADTIANDIYGDTK
ncbi:AMP-dependent synthetase/ligase [Actinotignum urinale]|uniref:AMP-dependent synthetase/ligase n=1 Tax=Actinotignum urinale TaxID=190146 RepID=UPI00370D897D